MRALPQCIHSKSRMRERARTDLCGGRRVIGVPTATTWPRLLLAGPLFRQRGCPSTEQDPNLLEDDF